MNFIEKLKQVGVILNQGAAASFTEAAASELRDRMQLVGRELRPVVATMRGIGNPQDIYVSVEAFYNDRVIVEHEARYFSFPYTIADNNAVTFGKATEVTREFAPVAMREAIVQPEASVFVEALDKTGTRWLIRVIKAGLSGNRNFYPDVVLREAVSLFNGVRVFAKADEEHIRGKGKSFRNLIGKLSNATFIESKQKDSGEIRAELTLLQSNAGNIPQTFVEAYQNKMTDLFGFSIDADGKGRLQNGQRVATQITKVKSVDLIIEPGAGGELLNLIEAVNENPEERINMGLRERMIAKIKEKNGGSLPDGLDVDNEEQLEQRYAEALAVRDEPAKKPGDDDEAAKFNEAVDNRLNMIEAKANMRAKIAESKLPEKARLKLRKQFDGLQSFTEAQVDEAIKDEREYLAAFTSTGKPDTGGTSFIESGDDRADKVGKMLDAFFDRSNRDVTSFKECYVEITGDRKVTGYLKDCDISRLREAVSDEHFRESIDSSTFSNILGSAIHRALIPDYRQNTRYDVWRDACNVVPASDFRTMHRTRQGGYGDLPTVGEGAPYTALTTPTDEEATYSVSKKGGTEDVTLETIKNDDVGVIQRIPMKLSRAAKRTLSKFVLDFIRTNPAIYDSVALFHATHNNLGSAALDATSLAAARLRILKQTELSSADRIGIPPEFLWVPFDLEETAFDLFRRTTNNDEDFVESLQMKVRPVWYWTDANDWAVTCNVMDVPFIELAFLDGNEEPEIFIQDNPTQGSMFASDKLTWKIRHIYGAGVEDYRGADKSVVA